MTSWFNKSDLQKLPIITLPEPIYGYVLPHAGTTYTGNIISHILRFRGKNWRQITKAIIYYYPADPADNHELTVPAQSIEYLFGGGITITGINLGDPKILNSNTLSTKFAAELGNSAMVIISADMSHFMPFQEAIREENKAFHALMFKKWTDSRMRVVDDVITFKHVFTQLEMVRKIRPLSRNEITMRWIGRTRSPGESAVGYAGFLLVGQHTPAGKMKNKMAGLFVTCYDTDMNTRECLGRWGHYSPEQESALVNEVLTGARTTSRLTGGQFLDIPVKYYTVTYLYPSEITGNSPDFIRGWHGVKSNGAFYIPEVFLEDTFDNGRWITPEDNEWPIQKTGIPGGIPFDMTETLKMLSEKAGSHDVSSDYELYDTYTKNVIINKSIIPRAITLKKPRRTKVIRILIKQ